MDWQPIETAPKDGTEIICFCPSYSEKRVSVRAFDDFSEVWDGIHGWTHCDGEDAPTHWMPLPEAPK